MRRLLAAAVLASVVEFLATPLASAAPMTCKDWNTDQDWKADQIDVTYVEPRDPAFQPIHDRLKQRRILEELKEFLSPLRLPQNVSIKVEQCDQPSRPYRSGGQVTICYEYIDRLTKLAEKIPVGETTPLGATREDAVVGAFVQVVLYETAHPILEMQQIPVWGRESDAADKLAAYLMLQFGPIKARKLMNGAAYFFEASERTWTGSDFADVRSPEVQRFFNYLCIAYGSDNVLFKDYVALGLGGWEQPSGKVYGRVYWCPKEFQEMKTAFNNYIKPCLDQDRYDQVLGRGDWFELVGGQ